MNYIKALVQMDQINCLLTSFWLLYWQKSVNFCNISTDIQSVLSESLDSDGGGVHLTAIFVVIHGNFIDMC